jgi:hypothetical protein
VAEQLLAQEERIFFMELVVHKVINNTVGFENNVKFYHYVSCFHGVY